MNLALLLASLLACLPEIGKDEAVTDDSSTGTDSGSTLDADQDGYPAATDCNDQDANIHPGATEVCDGVDNNCVDGTDEGVQTTWYTDADGDAYGDDATATRACSPPGDSVSTTGGDCDDRDGAIHPNATELCDGVDNDCDGTDDPVLNVLQFETNDSVVIPDADALDFGVSGTIEAWIWWFGNGSYLFSKHTLAVEDKQVWVQDNHLQALLSTTGIATDRGVSSTPTTVPMNRWVHVAVSWQSGRIYLFLDGELVGSSELSTNGDPADGLGALYIGQATRADAESPLPGLDGYISDVRVSQTVRYTTEFTPDPSLDIDTNTAMLYKLDEGGGGAVYDTNTIGFPGAIFGATWTTAACRR